LPHDTTLFQLPFKASTAHKRKYKQQTKRYIHSLTTGETLVTVNTIITTTVKLQLICGVKNHEHRHTLNALLRSAWSAIMSTSCCLPMRVFMLGRQVSIRMNVTNSTAVTSINTCTMHTYSQSTIVLYSRKNIALTFTGTSHLKTASAHTGTNTAPWLIIGHTGGDL